MEWSSALPTLLQCVISRSVGHRLAGGRRVAVIAVVLGLILGLGSAYASAQTLRLLPNIETAAGTGTAGETTAGGAARGARIGSPGQAGFDAFGNVYFSDTRNYIYKIDRLGGLAIVAGTGVACPASTAPCGDGGPAILAQLNNAYSVAVDRAGNVFIADLLDNRIREIVAATGTITTLVGTGIAGALSSTTPIPGTQANIYRPSGLALDGQDNLYFSDPQDHVIYKYFAKGVHAGEVAIFVNTSHTRGYSPDGTAAAAAEVSRALGVAVDGAQNLFIADQDNNCIRMISSATGKISTVVGNGTAGYSGDGGPAIAAQIDGPRSIAFDNAGDLILSNSRNDVVRIVYAVDGMVSTNSTIATWAGNGASCSSSTVACGDGGLANQARFASGGAEDGGSTLVAYNQATGRAYISDLTDFRLRELSPSNLFAPTPVTDSVTQTVGFVVTGGAVTIESIKIAAGTEFTLGSVSGCAVDGKTSNLAGTVCRLPVTFRPAYPGMRSASVSVATSNGTFTFGTSGVGIAPHGVLSSGRLGNYAGTGIQGYTATGAAKDAQIASPRHAVVDNQGDLYFADAANHVVRKVTASTGLISTIAGIAGRACSPTTAKCGDGGEATAARLNAPEGVAIDSAGNLYIADTGDNRVREVDQAGRIRTIAGTGAVGYTGDAGLATSATLSAPTDLAIDGNGLLYIADSGNNVIRSTGPGSLYLYTAAGTGTPCPDVTEACGDRGPALLANLDRPEGVAIDAVGNLVIADTGDNRVRLLSGSNGSISTVVGTGAAGYTGDGTAAVSATLSSPRSVAVDPAGDYYIADSGNGVVRATRAATGLIRTLAGSGTSCSASAAACGQGDVASAARLTGPGGVALDSAGNLYIADTGDNRVWRIDGSVGALAFSPTAPGLANSDSRQTATLENVGNSSLIFFPPSSETNPSVADGFTLGSASSCPLLTSGSSAGTLAAGDSCTYAIGFSPSTAGGYAGALVVGDNSLNDSTATQTISLSAAATRGVTRTTVTAEPSASSDGRSVTVAVTGAAGTPSGSVTFYSGTRMMGRATLSGSGAATLVTKTLPPGTGSLLAVYTGDANYLTSTGTAFLVSGPTVGMLTTSNASPSYGASSTLTDTIAEMNGARPTGTVTFFNGSAVVGTVAVNSSGVAMLSISSLATGANSLTAAYGGDANYAAGSSNTLTVNVTKANGPDTLTISNASPTFGTMVTLTDTIPTAGAGTSATGTVTFYNGSAALGTGTVNSAGVATLSTGSLPIGTDSVTAVYGGDGNYATVTSNAASATVGKASGADSLTTSNPAPVFGASVTFTDTVPTVNGVAPTGSVNFYNGSAAIGSAAVGGAGAAAISVSSLPVGANSITAVYGGDSSFAPVTSNAVAANVGKANGADSLTTSNQAPQFGAAVSLSDSIPTVNGVMPTGLVTFYSGAVVIGTVKAASVATLLVSNLPVGTASISAVYSGDGTYSQASSNTVVETVSKAGGAGSDSLTSSNNPQVLGGAITFTDVAPTGGGVAPTGSVVFSVGSIVLGTVTLDAFGAASLTVSNLPLGATQVTAAYSGDGNYNPATSNFVVETVVNPDFSITATLPSATVDPGGAAAYNISVAGLLAPFDLPVTLSATGLPTGAMVTFAPASLTPGAGPVTTTMTISTSSSQARLGSLGASDLRYAWLLAPLLGIKRIRRRLRSLPMALVACLLLGAVGALTGCAGGYFGNAPHTYTITVIGTSGSLQHNAGVDLTIR